jgi:hypothetical protein
MTDRRSGPSNGNGSPPDPATLNEVLQAEMAELRPSLLRDFQPSRFSDPPEDRATNLKDIYRRIASGEVPLSALCLSGGGIRSATFNLGVLQSLARIGLLDKFDYLSSVSGGGYIASWLRTWIYRESRVDREGVAHRDGLSVVGKKLGNLVANENPLSPEPAPVSNLRDFSNYLTPKLGLFSGDTWAAAAIIGRNLLLNWLVLVPLLSAFIGIPLVLLLFVRAKAIPELWHERLLYAAIGIEVIASLLVYCFRRFAKSSAIRQWQFILFCVLPICAAAGVLSTASLSLDLPWRSPISHPCCTGITNLQAFSFVWCVVVPVFGWSVAQVLAFLYPPWTYPTIAKGPNEQEGVAQAQGGDEGISNASLPRDVPWGWELVALVLSGIVGMVLLIIAVSSWFSYLYNHPALYVILVLPILLGIYLMSRALFVGLASLSETVGRARDFALSRNLSELISSDDSDREWWARLSGWVLQSSNGLPNLSSRATARLGFT